MLVLLLLFVSVRFLFFSLAFATDAAPDNDDTNYTFPPFLCLCLSFSRLSVSLTQQQPCTWWRKLVTR